MIFKDNLSAKKLQNESMIILGGCNDTKVRAIAESV